MKTPRVPEFLFVILSIVLLSDQLFAGIQGPLKALKLKHKNDVIIMINGDRNTGEIKKMQFGVLYLKSDLVADTMRLDWERVTGVQSIARYEFETRSKDLYVGIIFNEPGETSAPGELRIRLDNGSIIKIKIPEIISIREMGESFFSRIDLAMDAGISFTSANERTQYNFNLNASFRRPRYSTTLQASSLFSDEPDVEETSRHEIAIMANRFLKRKWEAVAIAGFLHDNQQDLQLRTTMGGGIQRTFYESNRTLFYSIGGVVYTKENYFPEAQSDRNNAEALAALGLSTYRFRGSSFNSLVSVFVSLSDPGRVRVDSNLNWKWDIITDLYWRISFIDNYDNSPPETGINHNLNITSTIGWSF